MGVVLRLVPPNELKFWEMVTRLSGLDQSQSEALYERIWVWDIGRYGETKYISEKKDSF
jgi:hypothetical protein